MGTSKPSRLDGLRARLASLRERHGSLDTEIEQEQKRPAPNPMRLRLLKSRKLILRDEMTYYEGVLRTLQTGGSIPAGTAEGRGSCLHFRITNAPRN